MEKSRFGLLDDQELRFLDSLVVHNSLSSKTWLGLMLGMKVTENQCSCKDVVSNGYLETSFCFLNIFLLKGQIIQAHKLFPSLACQWLNLSKLRVTQNLRLASRSEGL